MSESRVRENRMHGLMRGKWGVSPTDLLYVHFNLLYRRKPKAKFTYSESKTDKDWACVKI